MDITLNKKWINYQRTISNNENALTLVLNGLSFSYSSASSSLLECMRMTIRTRTRTTLKAIGRTSHSSSQARTRLIRKLIRSTTSSSRGSSGCSGLVSCSPSVASCWFRYCSCAPGMLHWSLRASSSVSFLSASSQFTSVGWCGGMERLAGLPRVTMRRAMRFRLMSSCSSGVEIS